MPEDAAGIVAKARERLAAAPGLFREFESGKAMRSAMEIAEDFNLYVTEAAPWKEKDPERARQVCAAGVFASQVIAAILAPVLPKWAEAMQTMLGLPGPLTFESGAVALPAGHKIGRYITLAERVEAKQAQAIIEASKESLGEAEDGGEAGQAAADYEVEALTDEATIDAFTPIDLRVGRVAECNAVEGAKKLLQLTVDLGPLGTRNIFSGIARSYKPEQLVGKHVAVFANLAARKMRFGLSEGMILASGASDDAVTVLELDPAKSKPGERIT
ncbi:MAG: methionine--tRNA ligase subunit beta [Myxococcota bacterium]